MCCDVGEVKERLENKLYSFSILSVTSPTSQFILQPFRRFTYVTSHSPTLPLLHIRHSSAHSPIFPSLHLRHSSAHSLSFQLLYLCHSSFSNPSLTLPMSQLILQPFRCLTYVTALLILQSFSHFTYIITHPPTLPSLYLRHSIFQPFFRFSYVTSSSLNSPGEPPMMEVRKEENQIYFKNVSDH